MGIPCRVMGQTGVAAVIDGSNPGKTVALRADIDANDKRRCNGRGRRSLRHTPVVRHRMRQRVTGAGTENGGCRSI